MDVRLRKTDIYGSQEIISLSKFGQVYDIAGLDGDEASISTRQIYGVDYYFVDYCSVNARTITITMAMNNAYEIKRQLTPTHSIVDRYDSITALNNWINNGVSYELMVNAYNDRMRYLVLPVTVQKFEANREEIPRIGQLSLYYSVESLKGRHVRLTTDDVPYYNFYDPTINTGWNDVVEKIKADKYTDTGYGYLYPIRLGSDYPNNIDCISGDINPWPRITLKLDKAIFNSAGYNGYNFANKGAIHVTSRDGWDPNRPWADQARNIDDRLDIRIKPYRLEQGLGQPRPTIVINTDPKDRYVIAKREDGVAYPSPLNIIDRVSSDSVWNPLSCSHFNRELNAEDYIRVYVGLDEDGKYYPHQNFTGGELLSVDIEYDIQYIGV